MRRLLRFLRSPLSYTATTMWAASVALLILVSEHLISLGTGLLGITLIFVLAMLRALYVEVTRASAEVHEVKEIVAALARPKTEKYPGSRNRRSTDRW